MFGESSRYERSAPLPLRTVVIAVCAFVVGAATAWSFSRDSATPGTTAATKPFVDVTDLVPAPVAAPSESAAAVTCAPPSDTNPLAVPPNWLATVRATSALDEPVRTKAFQLWRSEQQLLTRVMRDTSKKPINWKSALPLACPATPATTTATPAPASTSAPAPAAAACPACDACPAAPACPPATVCAPEKVCAPCAPCAACPPPPPPAPAPAPVNPKDLPYDPMHPKRVCIVQYDTRSLASPNSGPDPYKWLPHGDRDFRIPFWTSSAVVNYQYALKHGYDFVAFQSSTGNCRHPTGGGLFPGWCKVLAVMHAQKIRPDAELYIYLDSDSYFYGETMTADDVLAKAVESNPAARTATVLVSRENYPGCLAHQPNRHDTCLCNSGVSLWRNPPANAKPEDIAPNGMAEMVTYWWSLAGSDKYAAFRENWPGEQAPLSAGLASEAEGKYPKSIAIIYDDYPHSGPDPLFNSPKGVYIRHFWSDKDGWPFRIDRFHERLKEAVSQKFYTETLKKQCVTGFESQCRIARIKSWPDVNGDQSQFMTHMFRNLLPYIPVASFATDSEDPNEYFISPEIFK